MNWIDELLGRGADTAPWLVADRAETRSDLRRAVISRQKSLSGIGTGSVVALRLPPGPAALHTLFALWRLDAQVMLVDTRLPEPEVARLYSLHPPTHEITDAGLNHLGPGADPGDIRLVQFSSGSTGLPKVIGRTAEDLSTELDRYAVLDGMPQRGGRILLLNSLIHTMGLVGGVLHGLASGAELILPIGTRAAGWVERAAEHRVTAILGVPLHFELLSRTTPPPLPDLQLAVSAGEMLPPAVNSAFEARFGVPVNPVYGTTETGILTAELTKPCPPPRVGRPVSNTTIRVTDGELYVRLDRSPYLRADGVDRFDDGWLRTFDRAELADDGETISILGRADSVVTVAGLKIDLMEVESVLRAHPGVTEAVVVHSGSAIEAYVGAPEEVTAAELLRWCRERLSDFKVPKRFAVDRAVPRNPTGKLIRSHELLHAHRGKGDPHANAADRQL
ncbi:class I adenylate-forming enzyme family protein [Actinokineospora diospyrosa]|uniref:Acyl-CoA synthetase (AMP-forming)/AMP-acid ligase II n=1 Tax=Actinokineospora diospyrosa TaxID=103728 RepID=A0ABT1IMI8_9PSEU|nr:fatty acid--CoA ligase family protein [Actinokineospora diospyrosa]MCP2273884.1 Acyl-CoA synthetase (AMP-forming)/AMP-acid ligase II [Actinokineospora diospyrosa]